MTSFPDPSVNPGPRILPKVFSDVPSANELADAKAEVAAARSSRNMLLLVVVLLLGMLIAAGAALVYFESQTRELPAKIEELQKDKAELEEELLAADKEIEEINERFDEELLEYSDLDSLISKNDELREKIAKVLEDKPTARSEYKPALGSEKDTSPFKIRGWLQLKDAAKQGLVDETKKLEEILDTVEDHRPPRRSSGFDPR